MQIKDLRISDSPQIERNAETERGQEGHDSQQLLEVQILGRATGQTLLQTPQNAGFLLLTRRNGLQGMRQQC